MFSFKINFHTSKHELEYYRPTCTKPWEYLQSLTVISVIASSSVQYMHIPSLCHHHHHHHHTPFIMRLLQTNVRT